MTPDVLIAQISDLHIKLPGELAYGQVDTAAALKRCVAELNRLNPRPQLVVISGDLADTPTPEEYDYLKSMLAALEIPFVAMPGNHDDRPTMRAALPHGRYAHATGALDSIQSVGMLDIVLLDSSTPGKPYGTLENTTLKWLDAALGATKGRPALVFLHHPPFVTGIKHMDVQNLHNAKALGEIVNRHPRVRLIAAGHVHRATLTQFAGIPATICPAPNHAVALDLNESLPPSFKVEPPAFHLHAWRKGDGGYGELVTHHVPIGDFKGPLPFFGPDGKLL
jgi:3',5'-cyclic AMP phosphodiesterase CpdA